MHVCKIVLVGNSLSVRLQVLYRGEDAIVLYDRDRDEVASRVVLHPRAGLR